MLKIAMLMVLASACSTDAPLGSPTADEAGTLLDASADAGIDAFAAADAVPATEPECTASLSWSTSAQSLPYGVDHHMTFVADTEPPALYVAGGNDYQASPFKRSVLRATIGADGQLSPFVAAGSLPAGRAGSGVVLVNNRVYLVAGRALNFLSSVIMAEIASDGGLGPWQTLSSLPEGRFHLTAEHHEGRLYAIGGLGPSGEASDTIYVASIEPDGTLGQWSLARTLPRPRSHHGSFVSDGQLYLSGGFEGNPVGNQNSDHLDVIRGALQSDGTVAELEQVGQLPASIATHAHTRVDDCVFLFGGINIRGAVVTYNNIVLRSQFNGADLASFEPLPARAPEGRSHMHQAPYYRGRFYLVGGSKAYQDVTGAVMIGALAP